MKITLLQKIKWRSLTKAIVIGIVTIFCVLPLLYFVVLRDIDATICYRSLGHKLGVPGDYNGIVTYVKQNTKPGMSRDAVHARLSEIGKLDVIDVTPYDPDLLVQAENLYLNICHLPVNNIQIIVRYDKNWIVDSAHIFDE
jgi:hypothetical protein